ncbi:MAG TPA: TIGR03118 family protein [Steroidobacteraceae bacterium]|nr:TIGR03118 family protein [Steroidobacteraceae bacterium]
MNIATASLRSLLASALLSVAAAGVYAQDDDADITADSQPGFLRFYHNTPLVSNGAVPANFTDPNLRNGWGVAFNPQGFVWVADQVTGVATLYDGSGQPSPQPTPLIVHVPGPDNSKGAPTGIVFSAGMDFVVSKGGVSGPARFIFATLQGNLAGWAPNVDATHAVFVPTGSEHAVYTGLALGGNGTTHLLYAANFVKGSVDVFDGTFKRVTAPGGFVDNNLPARFAPFGIQAINGDIYVTYAKQNDEGDEELHGAGLGIVNVFDPDGHLRKRMITRRVLNAPWGIALAPRSFGKFGGALLVGNLGDGRINAFAPRNGAFLGTLRDRKGKPIEIDGLWGIQFGNGILGQKTNALFYASGPNDEADGAYGVITAATASIR